MKSVLFAAGYLNLDITAEVDRLPEFGGRVTARSISRSGGGMTANMACAAARLGLAVSFFGRVGQDEAGQMALAELNEFGVETRWVVQSDRPTTTALILLNPAGDRTIISEPASFDYAPLNTALESVDPATPRCLHVDGYRLPEAIPILEKARTLGFFTSADLDGIEPDELGAIAPKAAPHLDLIFLNQRLADSINPEPTTVSKTLLQFGAKIVSLTLGERGALIAASGQIQSIPALSNAVVRDTTGAGDVFAGAFLAAWLSGKPVIEAGQFAVVASAISLDTSGARGHLPTWNEVMHRLPTTH